MSQTQTIKPGDKIEFMAHFVWADAQGPTTGKVIDEHPAGWIVRQDETGREGILDRVWGEPTKSN